MHNRPRRTAFEPPGARSAGGRPFHLARTVAPPQAFARCDNGPVLRLDAIGAAQLLLAVAVVTSVVVSVYYFNLFVDMEQDVATAQAQIDRELQRRADLIENLLPAVFEYAQLERHVFTEVARTRSQLAGLLQSAKLPPGALTPELLERLGPGAQDLTFPPPVGEISPGETPAPPGNATQALVAGGDPISKVLGRLVAVSEQYPDMKSGGPFNTLMEKVTEIEDRLAVERQSYNNRVNEYTTLTSSFPGKVFAKVFGFEDRHLFEAGPEAQRRPTVTWSQGYMSQIETKQNEQRVPRGDEPPAPQPARR